MNQHSTAKRVGLGVLAVLIGSMANVAFGQVMSPLQGVLTATPDMGAYGALPQVIGYQAALSGGGGGGGYGGGTVAGNYLSGAAQVIRSAGDFNEATSRAYINYEEARGLYITNRRKWTDAYFALQEQNRARVIEKIERARHSPEVLAAAAHSSVPRPLNSYEFNLMTGKIDWPEFLQSAEFAGPRERIERIAGVRAEMTLTATDRATGRQAVGEMLEALRADIHVLPANEYIANRKFLDSLYFTLTV